MNGWIAAAMWGGAFLVLAALSLFAVAYVGDSLVKPAWPGVR